MVSSSTLAGPAVFSVGLDTTRLYGNRQPGVFPGRNTSSRGATHTEPTRPKFLLIIPYPHFHDSLFVRCSFLTSYSMKRGGVHQARTRESLSSRQQKRRATCRTVVRVRECVHASHTTVGFLTPHYKQCNSRNRAMDQYRVQ